MSKACWVTVVAAAALILAHGFIPTDFTVDTAGWPTIHGGNQSAKADFNTHKNTTKASQNAPAQPSIKKSRAGPSSNPPLSAGLKTNLPYKTALGMTEGAHEVRKSDLSPKRTHFVVLIPRLRSV